MIWKPFCRDREHACRARRDRLSTLQMEANKGRAMEDSTDLEEGEVDEEEHEGWFCEPEVGVADLHQRDALDHGVPLRDVDGHAADDALQLRPHGQDDHHRHNGYPEHGVPSCVHACMHT